MRLQLALPLLLLASTSGAARPPNLVVLVVDDLGTADLGCYNSGTFYETPHIDRLARAGCRFTQGYAANPVCSPTRYSLLTGRYPTHARLTNWLHGVREGRFAPAPLARQMEPDEVTIAEALKPAGYRTLFTGKWHLGDDPAYWPEAQGFDVNVGGWSAGSPGSYFSPYRNPALGDGPPGEHLTLRLAEESVRLIEQAKDGPFFLFHSFYAVHNPLEAPPELVAKYEQKARRLGLAPGPDDFAEEEQVWPVDEPRRVRVRQNSAKYAAMVELMDRAVGRILDRIEALGLADDTVVIFTSDNGGLSTAEGLPTSNLPFRGGKGWIYEGGIREPWIVRWPGVTAPGTTSDVPICSIDLFPTLLAAANPAFPADPPVDGCDVRPALQGGTLARDALFWHYPHYSNQGGFPGGAVRIGAWKLIERYEDGRVQLFDLAADPGERRDLADVRPEVVGRLRRRLHGWYAETGAEFLRARRDKPAVPWRPRVDRSP